MLRGVDGSGGASKSSSERLTTSAPRLIAKRRPRAIVAASLLPSKSSTRTGMIFDRYATPTVPNALFAVAPTMLATNVPWPNSSLGIRVVVDEVVAAHEALAIEVGRLCERPAAGVRDAAVEDRDGDAAPAAATCRLTCDHAGRRVDPERAGELPLHGRPSGGRAGGAGDARVVGDVRRARGQRALGPSDGAAREQPSQRLLRCDAARVARRPRAPAIGSATLRTPAARSVAARVAAGTSCLKRTTSREVERSPLRRPARARRRQRSRRARAAHADRRARAARLLRARGEAQRGDGYCTAGGGATTTVPHAPRSTRVSHGRYAARRARVQQRRKSAHGRCDSGAPAMATPFFPRDEYYMRLALREAQAALAHDDVPIGAVVVHDGEVIAAGTTSASCARIRPRTPSCSRCARQAACSARGACSSRSCT